MNIARPRCAALCALLLVSLVTGPVIPRPAAAADEPKPIAISEIKRDAPVNFEKDILPILSKNCLACHNGTKAENGLVLETPQTILKGGEGGPAVVPGKSAMSLLLKAAAHQADPVMPPPDNNVGAKPLSSDDLGLVKLWIDQGATGEVTGAAGPVKWQPLPPGINPIYAVAITPDGQFAACGRANQIFVYHLPSGRLVTRLTDPELLKAGLYKNQGVAHLDMVQSLAFSPDGNLLASGAYREAKLWRRPHDVQRLQLAGLAEAPASGAVSPDGKMAATGDAKGAITVWDLTTGKPIRTLAGHTAAVTAIRYVAASAAGAPERLISASADKSLRIWNSADGTPLARIDTPAPLTALAVLADGLRVATGGADNLVRIWTLPAAGTRDVADVPGAVTAAAASPDKKTIAVAAADGNIALVDAATGKATRSLPGRKVAVAALSFSGDGTRLAASEADGTLRVWDVAQGMPLATLSGAVSTAIALQATGNALATGTADGKLTIWKLDVPAPAAVGADLEAPAAILAASGDGKRVAAGTTVGGKPTIVVRELPAGNVVAALAGHEGPITALALNADGTKLVSGSADKTARLWNVADGKELAKFAGHGGPVTAVTLNAGATQVASGAADNSLKLWNAADGAEIKNFAGAAAPIVGVALSANGQSLVSAGAEKTVRIWNLADGAQARAIEAPAAAAALALSRDDARLALSLADGSAQVCQFADGKLLATLAAGGPARGVGFSADGNRLAVALDKQIGVWDVATQTLLESLGVDAGCGTLLASGEVVTASANKLTRNTLHAERAVVGPAGKITRLAFKPGATLLFAASADGTLRGYEATSGQQAFSAAAGVPIHDLAVSPDGKLLATACEDKQVRVWNENGSPAAKPQLGGFTAAVGSVAFSPDGARIVAAGAAPGEVFVFNVASGLVEQSFAEQPAPTTALAASGEKDLVVLSAAGDKGIKLWPLAAGAVLANHAKPITALVASPTDANLLFSAADENAIRQWNLQNGQVTRQLDHGAAVSALALRGDGVQLASAGGSSLVRLWKVDNGQAWAAPNNQPLPELKGDLRAQLQAAASERLVALVTNRVTDDKKAASDAEAKIKTTEEAIKTTATAKEAATKTMGEKVEAAKAPVAAKEAAEKELQEAAAVAKAELDKATAAKETADKDAANADLKKASEDAKKVADEAETKRKAAEKKLTDAAAPAAKAQQEATSAEAAAMAADQAALAAVASNKKAIDALPVAQAAVKTAEGQLTDAQAKLEAAKKLAAELEKPFRSLAYSADGSMLAAGGDNQIVRTFSTENGAALDSFSGHQGPVAAVAFLPAGDLLSLAADKLGIVWNTTPPWTLERTIGNVDDPSIFVDRVLALAFSPDGKLLATGGGEPSRSGEVKLWNTADGNLVRAITPSHSDTVFGIEFSPDGQYLASSAADRFVKVFDVNAGTLFKAFEGHTHHVLDVAWRSDGKTLASSGADNVIKVWDFTTGDQKLTTTVMPKEVTSVTYVALLNKFISSSGDRTVRLYNADNPNPERQYSGANDFIYSAAVTADGKIVVAGGQDSTLLEWNLENGQSIHTYPAPKPAEEPAAASK